MENELSDKGYKFVKKQNIWKRPDYEGIPYSDGDVVEERIGSAIAESVDLSVLSPEFKKHCTDWPSLYHLSGERANILRPFASILENNSVLEIGAGCGAITRYLGETNAQVIALEGSLRRAAIAKSRVRDFPHVTVVSDRFDMFDIDQKFDFVTLIGVLEYASMFTPGESPVHAMFDHVRKFLKPNGQVIIAIENQLGLKYFAGAPEDHLNQVMYGIEGRYLKGQPQTYGRKVLERILRESGFASIEFMAPFPDYKMPTSIVTEQGFLDPDYDASALAWQSVKRDLQLPTVMNFSMELAWQQIFENQLALDLANSFLIVAGPDAAEDKVISDLAYHYSTGRRPCFCKETLFIRDSLEKIAVKINWLCEESYRNDRLDIVSVSRSENGNYEKGVLLSKKFIEIVSQDDWSIEDLNPFFVEYLDIVRQHCIDAGGSPKDWEDLNQVFLPGRFMDMVPQNIVQKADGQAVLIDQEWILSTPISLGHLIFRVVLWMIGFVTRFGHMSEGRNLTRGEFVDQIFKLIGLQSSVDSISTYNKRETEIQSFISGIRAEELRFWQPELSLPTTNLNTEICKQAGRADTLEAWVRERDISLIEMNKSIRERDKSIRERDISLMEMNKSLNESTERQDAIKIALQAMELGKKPIKMPSFNSKKYLKANPDVARSGENPLIHYLFSGQFENRSLGSFRNIFSLIIQGIRGRGGLFATVIKAINKYRRFGVFGIKEGMLKVRALDPAIKSHIDYSTWVQQYDSLDKLAYAKIRKDLEGFEDQVNISVVMPVYNPPIEFLKKAIQSVLNQLYPNWELCIADDHSTDPQVRQVLEKYQAGDSRIKVIYRKQNGHISAASNSAIGLATGDYIALMDHDDELTEHALYWVAKTINEKPGVGLIYSDEDKITETGERYDPYFKPELDPFLLLAQNMISHLGIYRSDLIREIGGFREGFEGAQDYDLVLRALENMDRKDVAHIPRILYHWRAISGSTAVSGSEKSYAEEAGLRAVEEHLKRTSVEAKVVPAPKMPNLNRVIFKRSENPPLLSIIIPTRDNANILEVCVNSILDKTTYPNYEIIVIDNGSVEKATLKLFSSWPKDKIRVIRDESPFNFSAINNRAAKSARGELICLINNDIEIITSDWAEEMASFATMTEVGCVGARLWYPDGRLQHGGVIIGLGGVAGHAHKYIGKSEYGYFARAILHQSMSAVTAACLMVRRNVYEAIDGLDEELSIAFNDIDFCLRVREAGYRNIWTPYAEMIHYESISRGTEDDEEKQARFNEEIRFMEKRWGDKLATDPAYNPNLTIDREDFSLASPPRVS